MHRDVIAQLGNLSDGQLATPLAEECAVFAKEEHTHDETVKFLRDLRDICVHDGAASSFVMAVLATLLPDREPDDEAEERRAALRKRYGMPEPSGEEIKIKIADPQDVHFRACGEDLWEKVVNGKVAGRFRTVETKPPPWPGNDASDEVKMQWKQEADRRMAHADEPDVEMFFTHTDIVFAEPVKD